MARIRQRRSRAKRSCLVCVVAIALAASVISCGVANTVSFAKDCQKEMSQPIYGLAEDEVQDVCVDLFEVDQMSPSQYENYEACMLVMSAEGKPMPSAVSSCVRIGLMAQG